MILVGGPAIGEKEKLYTADAVANGWNEHHSDYKHRFELMFARYVGAKFAYSTTGGTQALWLSLAALGVGPGDEVILPDVTYFACSDVIKLVGATPVFVDILPTTWCIDPLKFEQAITPKTKAIMPVWLYGNAPEMNEIVQIAKKHNLLIVEDACPAVGTFYHGKHAGTFGNTGCFSFHGAKIMTTGFGGMIVTDDKDLYRRIVFLDDHGEDKSLPHRFWQTEIGFSTYMHNINAALGLAQLEHIEEMVEKKRQIFDWYKKYINVSDFEQDNVRTNRWLPSLLVENREEVMQKLRDKDIDSRPVFFPISMFPMYEEQNTPVAHRVGLHGISLPSGHARTEDEITFIAKTVKELL